MFTTVEAMMNFTMMLSMTAASIATLHYPIRTIGVVAGIVGGALDGREGGLLGATGGEALDLKQVARAPQVLEQLKPRYPRRAKADGIEGLVLVRIIIGADGRVEPEHTRVIRSVPELVTMVRGGGLPS